MKILLASSEVHPYSKTGGLADMVGAFGKALARAGHQVRIVTPLYRCVREKVPQIKRENWRFDLPLGASREQAELWSIEIEKGLTVYFIDQPEFYSTAPGCIRNMTSAIPTTPSGSHSFPSAW